MSERLQSALDLLRAGRRAEGERLLASAAEGAKRVSGAGSIAHAAALFELAQWLLAAGERERALGPMREAASLVGTDPDSTRALLTYGMHLGEVLESCGRFEEAVEVLRQNVAARTQVYGEDAVGLAWGLEPLASALLVAGRAQEAEAAAQRALNIRRRAGGSRTAHAHTLVLVASARAACGGTPPFAPEIDELPEDVRAETLEEALRRLQSGPLGPALAVAVELASRGESRADAQARAWVHIERAAARAGLHDTRVAACRSYIELQRRAGDLAEVIDGTQGLAVALAQAGKVEEAGAAWRDAVQLARGAGDPAILSRVLRNHGMFAADRNADGWEDLLTEAITRAESIPGPQRPELAARARGALGIQLQHAGDTSRAERLLAEAVDLGEESLAPGDGDLIAIRTHLEALRSGKPCGCCGDQEHRAAMARAVEDLVRPHLPDGLLQHVELSPSGELSVHLTRQATAEEADVVNRALRQAHAELRAQGR